MTYFDIFSLILLPIRVFSGISLCFSIKQKNYTGIILSTVAIILCFSMSQLFFINMFYGGYYNLYHVFKSLSFTLTLKIFSGISLIISAKQKNFIGTCLSTSSLLLLL